MKTKTIGQCKDCKYLGKLEGGLLTTDVDDLVYYTCKHKQHLKFYMVDKINYGCWHWRNKRGKRRYKGIS